MPNVFEISKFVVTQPLLSVDLAILPMKRGGVEIELAHSR
jgi:hypothetical protein